MASRDRVESSLSFLQAGGDAIPREYHRKVLKKIAQLTKVIYTLNTKNDENEQFIAKLKATHEQDLDKILSDCTYRLQQCKEKLVLDYKQAEEKVVSLTESLASVEKERNDLIKEQNSYRKTVEERLGAVKTQHSEKILSLTTELEKFRKDQAKQLKELSEFRMLLSKNSSKQVEEMQQRHQEDMEQLQKKLQLAFSKERSSLEEEHKKEVASLKQEFEECMTSYKSTMSRSHEETVATERKQSEERENALKHELTQKEEQISSLLTDLRTTRDKLALSEQKVADLLAQCEDSQSCSTDIKSQLKQSEAELEQMKMALRETKNELEISREHYQQQSAEMKGMAAQVGKLEALCVSNEGVTGELRSYITGLKLKLKQLEEERNAVESSKDSITERQLARIKTLETDLDKLRRQKEEMHLQFAREIEAAQAQLGETEAQIGHKHLLALQQLRDENKQAALEATRDKEAALDKLRRQMESEKAEELQELSQRMEDEKSQLNSALSDKSSELDLAQEQLKRLEYELARKEQGMGSVSSSLDKLRAELVSIQGELATLQREKEATMKDKIKLLSAVECLKEQGRELQRSHQGELEKLKRQLTQELEDKWKERLKLECASLRQELSSRYGDDSRVALSELADIKDRALEKARKKWDAEKEKLLQQLSELEKWLQETQESSSALLDEAKVSSDSQITALRLELKQQNTRHTDFVDQQKQLHHQELEALKQDLTAEKDEFCEELRGRCDKEKRDLRHANHLAVEALREVMERQTYQQLEQTRLEHGKHVAGLRMELLSEYERGKEILQEQHKIDMQKQQDRIQKLLVERKNEVTQYERAMGSLNSDINNRNAELSKLRDKINTLMVGMNNLRKELEVKGQEVLMVRREANSLLQQRISEVSTTHSAELDSLATQYKYQSQMLISDFNKAKAIFTNKISKLEAQVSEWESRYRDRESKAEDLELIRQLTVLTQQHKQKIKDLIAEKRVYQLELINREKNYNQIFNANPCVGVLNPLSSKKKTYDRYPSAPSLVTPTEPHPPSPLSSTSGSLVPLQPLPAHTPTSTHSASAGQLFSRREQPAPPPSPAPPPAKPKRFVTLKDSPLNTRHRGTNTKEKNGGAGPENGVGPPIKPLEQIPPNETHTMTVQY